jgi:hypothetical protein
MDQDLHFAYTWIMKFILGMALLGVGIYFMHQNPLNDISKAYAEIGGVKGGFTAQDITDLKAELQKSGFDPAQLVIQVQAFDKNNNDVSINAVNITPFNQTPYPATPNFAPRGSKIILTVYSNEETTMNGVQQFLTGTKGNVKMAIRRVIMSERVR